MIRFLKHGISAEQDAADSEKVRNTVEGILADIGKRGDTAVREYSQKFDNWNPTDFRLTKGEIEDLVRQLGKDVVADIQFAQTQIRNFAQIQRDALKDV
jgi:sulfopropanediol 3-dehydrogenase